MTVTRRLLFSLLPLLILLVLAELLARALGGGAGLSTGGPLGWTMQPDLDEYLVDQPDPQLDFTVSTNGDGLRTGLGRASRPGRHRVAIFGESTIFGWGLPEAQAPAAALSRALGSDWDVVNAGQPGYSSEQSVRLAQALLDNYTLDGAIFFVPWNDLRVEQPDRERLPAHPAELRGWRWWGHSALLSGLVRRRANEAMVQQHANSPLFAITSRQDDQDRTRVSTQERAENLARFQALAKSHGLWSVAAILPQGKRYLEGGPDRYAREIIDLCAPIGLPFISLQSSLAGAETDVSVLPGDQAHFTGYGNQILMSALAVQLARLGYTSSTDISSR